MDMLGFLLITWMLSAVPGLLLSAPIAIAGRHRVTWRWWELLVTVVPFLGWFVLIVVDGAGKSLSNAFIEPMMISIALPPAAIARVAVGRSADERLVITCITTTLTAIAAAVYWFVPGLPEELHHRLSAERAGTAEARRRGVLTGKNARLTQSS